MTTITIDYAVPADAIARVEAFLGDAAKHNPSWNGAEFVIERDEFTGMDDDSPEAASLFAGVQRVIRGEEG